MILFVVIELGFYGLVAMLQESALGNLRGIRFLPAICSRRR